ncbi:MAG: hypothetical protein HY744_33345 [Deltaproteobacteria bacterium]|nr:hypothetical protein [Deltaproteobacteria bacterium]
MKTPLEAGEQILKQGAANLQRGIETVGGRLYLTNARLVLEAHAFNVQAGTTIVRLERVTSVRKCWTKFLNLVPLAPSSLAVTTCEGDEHRLVLWGRQAWIEAIEAQRARRG